MILAVAFLIGCSYSGDAASSISSGNLIWAKSAGGTGWADCGLGITTLSDNSTVVTGYFEGSATFGKDEPNEAVLEAVGYGDIFIARYNPEGSLAWVKQANGSGYGITTLSDDSTVVTGCFSGITTFGEGEPNETVLESAGGEDIFVARYKPDGTLLWTKRAGGMDWHDKGRGITTLSDNSIVVTGWFYETAAFGEGEPNETILESAGGEWDGDIFIARFNSDGTLAWAKRAGGSENDYGRGITTLSDDSTVVTGYLRETATFGESEPSKTVLNGEGGFIARYYSDSTLAWAKRVSGMSECYGITTLSDDSTVVTGCFSGVSTFGEGEANETALESAGSGDIFIARYNPDGTLAWTKRVGGIESDARECGNGISTLSDDSTVVTGTFYGAPTFGEGETNETVLLVGSVFIARYNPDGTLEWVKHGGGWDGEFCDSGNGITTLSDDSTILTGGYYLTATFGEGEPNETDIVSNGEYDIFIARFEP